MATTIKTTYRNGRIELPLDLEIAEGTAITVMIFPSPPLSSREQEEGHANHEMDETFQSYKSLMKPNPTFAESLKDLGTLVETCVLYQLPTKVGNLRVPLTMEIRQGEGFFFASVADIEMVVEGRTREKAVLNCLETLFEIYQSYAQIPSEQLTGEARAFLDKLRRIVADTAEDALPTKGGWTS